MSDKPCIKCEKRYPACQDYCPIGIQAKRDRQAQNDKLQKARMADTLNRDYIYEHYNGKGK